MKLVAIFVVSCLAVASAAPFVTKDDFRNEFDRMLYEEVREHIKKGEERLLHLQMQINEFEKTHNKDEKERIIREIDTVVALMQGAVHALDRELKRTDLDIFERYNFEMAQKSAEVLIKDLRKEEARIKKIEV